MPDNITDADVKLHKLGKRIQDGYAIQHPMTGKSMETVREAVREQWELDQKAKRGIKPAPDAAKEPERQAPEPEQDR